MILHYYANENLLYRLSAKKKNLHRIINIPFNKRTKTTMMMKKRDVKFSMFCRIGEDVAFEEIRRNKTNRTVQKKE